MGPYGLGFPDDGLPNRGWKLYITSLVVVITSGLFVLARISTRIRLAQLGKDDIAITVSWVSALSVSILMQLAVENGYGMKKADLDTPDLRRALRYFFFAQTPYKITVGLNKVAAIMLYLRIFPSDNFRRWSYGVMALIIAWSIGGVGATIFQCVPIEGAWNKSVGAKCIDSNKFWVAYAVMNVLTDVLVLILPIPPIARLQMGKRSKVMLFVAFGFGIVVTITSILRTTSVSNSLKMKEDITWNFIERGMWTLLEANLGIITACLPVLQKPLGAVFPWLFTTTNRPVYNDSNSRPGYNLSHLERDQSKNGWHFDQQRAGNATPVVAPTQGSNGSETQSIEGYYHHKGSDVDLRIAATPIDGSSIKR